MPVVKPKRAALAFRSHSGWAVMVALARPIEEPRVILRRHVVITSGPKQPYHAAATMALPDAEAFMKRCTTSTAALATEAVGDVVAELSSLGFRVGGSCVLLSEGKPAGDLARILSAHPLIHTAEGEFYRNDLRQACESCGLPCAGFRERGLLEQSSAALALPAAAIQKQLAAWGKTVGAPWRQDEKARRHSRLGDAGQKIVGASREIFRRTSGKQAHWNGSGMLSPTFDFDRFAAALTLVDTDLSGIRDLISLELQDADGRLGTARYCSLLRGLRHLIDTGNRPRSLRDDREFVRMRPVIECLVKNGFCDFSMLEVFAANGTYGTTK